MKKYNLINNVLGWLCFVVSAVTYLLTIEPTASFWDCPEFISQGAKLEVGHPPGNPIFMLAARFFVTLFGGMEHAAVAVNSMSALLSAGTILLLFWSITHLIKRLIVADDATVVSWRKIALIMGGGLCGALAYTWSDTFWFSAVEGEVYAFSSFCTALVFWLALKWENRCDEPHSDRYLVLIAYVIGVSIAVHLLNLLCIPAICLVFYYKRFGHVSAKGSLVALGVSCVIVGAILYGLVPGFVKVAQQFELFFVNEIGLSYNMGVLIYAVVLTGVFVWTIRSLYTQRSAGAIRTGVFLSVVLSGMPFIGSGWVVPMVIVIALAVYLYGFCRKVPVRLFNVIILSIFVIFIGYSSYALLLIRATANTPMNQNAPDNVFALASYLNREQYGDRPLFYGVAFAEELVTEEYPENSGNFYVAVDEYGYPRTQVNPGYLRDETGNVINDPSSEYTKVVKSGPAEPDRYVKGTEKPDYKTIPDMSMPLTRIYSTDPTHVEGYKGWAEYDIEDFARIPADSLRSWARQQYVPLYYVAPFVAGREVITTAVDASGRTVGEAAVWKPGFMTNLRYFVNYQLNHMYWRYFMWNFAGRQNDFQGNGEPQLGNWISGIPAIDNARLGDQNLLPDEYGKGNKGHNVFYMLPLLMGIIGLLWQALYPRFRYSRRGIEQFWVVFFLFFMTGIAIVLYLNQTPGQPRERDYAFAGSFYAFAIWIGLGVPAVASLLGDLLRRLARGKGAGDAEEKALPGGAKWAATGVAVALGIFVPLQMVSQTWDDHDRSGRYAARDFGMNYLNSLDDNAIIFTNGDNDTFPLWYAQEVEGVRTDVRVVNLSYLTTDWYANQLGHPTYDARPVDMYATPRDYGYDALAWSFVVPMNPEVTPAEASLRELYASDAGRVGAKYMSSPAVRLDYSRADAIKAFGIDTTGVDSMLRLPFMRDIVTDMSRLGSSGMSLSKVLSLDIMANSVAGGWKRPVYFATTVPSSYYIGLTPYLSSTGMAMQLTPFADAPASPTVEKAYENIMSRFRWGGLDTAAPGSLYLDETVRRMVASTRTPIYEAAEALMQFGKLPASKWAVDYAKANGQPVPVNRNDMARNLLHLIEEKLPASAAVYDGLLGVYMAQLYFDLYTAEGNADDLERAKALLSNEEGRYAQMIRYASALDPGRRSRLGRSDTYALQYLPMAIGLQNQIAVYEKLRSMPDAPADMLEYMSTSMPLGLGLNVYQWVYVDGMDLDTFLAGRDRMAESQRRYADEAIRLLQAHKAAGIDPMELTHKVVAERGIDLNRWRSL